MGNCYKQRKVQPLDQDYARNYFYWPEDNGIREGNLRGCNNPNDRYDGCRDMGAYQLKCPKNGFPEFMLHSHFNEDGTPKAEDEDEEVLDADVEDNITQESATESLLNAFEAYNLQ